MGAVWDALEWGAEKTGYTATVNNAEEQARRDIKNAAVEASKPKADWTDGLDKPEEKGANLVTEGTDNDTIGGSAALAEASQVDAPTHSMGTTGGGAVAVQNPLYVGRNPELLGQENLDEADQAMRAGIEAAGKIGDVEAREADAVAQSRQAAQDRTADLYAQMQKDREEDRAAIAKRQKQLEEETDRYTADLADRGKFWRNPGNVIATIFASLSTMGGASAAQASASVDRMIQNDWQQRKDLADTRLGALRSNLEGYRRLAGDKEAGDKLALAESYKMAEYDVERVASKLGSEKAKARAEALQQALKLKHAAVFMEYYEKMQVVGRYNARDVKTLQAAGVTTLGYRGARPQASPAAPVPPAYGRPRPEMPAAEPVGTGIGPGVAAPTTVRGGAAPPAAPGPQRAAAGPPAGSAPVSSRPHGWVVTPDGRDANFVMDDQTLLQRIGPAQQARFPKNQAAKEAMVRFAISSDRAMWNTAAANAKAELGKGAGIDKLNAATTKEYAKLMKAAEADAREAQARMAPVAEHVAGATAAKRALSEIRAAFTYRGPDGKERFNQKAADEVLKAGAATQLAPAKMHAVNAILAEAGLKTLPSAQVARWRADLFGGVSVFRKQVSGVAINEKEDALLAQIISVGADWNQFNGFVDSMYRKVATHVRSIASPLDHKARYLAALNMGSDRAAMFVYGDK